VVQQRLMRPTWWADSFDDASGHPLAMRLDRHAAVGVRAAMTAVEAATLAARVLAADDDLGDDFGGEQRSLGRPWYTHMETGRAAEYFRDAAGSDACVERVVPGVQHRTLQAVARVVGGVVRRRHGFCGPGVHVFPPGEKVARRGGVFHYDLEGLTPAWGRALPRAISVVWMLQPPSSGGGLSLFNKTYRGVNWPMDEDPAVRRTTTRMRAGDLLVFSSYRLHRINGFRGELARVSVTCHAVEVDRGVWDAWF
jgi:hypothetical protein